MHLLCASMRVGPETRDRRSVPRTAAAVLVLLAALLHLLACGHGPTASPDGPDARPIAGPVVVSGALPAALPDTPPDAPPDALSDALSDAHGDSGPGPERHCCHADEPSIQAPRDAGPVKHPGRWTGQEGVPGVEGPVPAGSVVRAGRPPRAPDRSGSPVGRSLARLGVWRT
jgi:hypothetical protein